MIGSLVGHMLIAWKIDLFELISLEYGVYSLSVKLFNPSSGFTGWISGVYNPSSNRGKEEFWIEILGLVNLIEGA